MRFGHPYFLVMLWLLPGLILFYVWAFRNKRRLIEQFVSADLKERLLSGVSPARQRFKAGLVVAGCFFTLLALLQPQWGFHWEEVKRRGVDIIVALDVSKSMLAEDISPNRIERAKRKIGDFLKIVQGDRIGLIAFAGTAFLQCPLTLDHGAVQIFLDSIDTDLIPVPGTAINEAIDLSIKAFAKSDRNSRALILITDGEQTTGDDIEAAKRANEQGIKIYTIGVGKEGGAPIPNGEGGGFKKDRQGNVVMTKLDEEGLQKLALETGGSYVRSVSGDLDLEKIYEDLRKNTQEKELKSGRQKRFEERFQWPLFLAFLCFAFEAILSERKGSELLFGSLVSQGRSPWILRWPWPKSRWTQNSSLLLLIGLSLLVSLSSVAFASSAKNGEGFYRQQKYNDALKEFVDAGVENPSSLQLKYNAANAYYKTSQFPEAEKLFQTVATTGDTRLSEKAYYNLGNTTFREGKLQESLVAFQKATELDPKDEDAKHNLEFVRKEIRRRMNDNKNRQQQQQQQQPSSGNQANNSKKDQDQSQGQQKNQQQQQQAQQQQTQGQQGKESANNQNKDQGKDKDKDKDKEKGSGAQQQAENNKSSDRKDTGGASAPQGARRMSDEEAKQWLSTLKEADRSKFQKKNAEGARQYEVEKDW